MKKILAPLLALIAIAAGIAASPGPQGQLDARPKRPVALESPTRITATPAGELWVADYKRHQVFRLDPGTLEILKLIDVGGRAMAIGALGDRLLVGNESAKQVQIYERTGALAGVLGGSGTQVDGPSDLSVDAQLGRVFVLDSKSKHVKVFDLSQPGTGQLIATIGAPGTTSDSFQHPTAIAIDPSAQEVFVSDFGDLGPGRDPRILVFGYDGGYRESISGDGGPTGQYFARPQGIALGTQTDHVFVVDSWRGEVVVMSRQAGAQVGVLGKYGRQPGELLLPLDAVVLGPDADLFVTSNRTSKVEKYAGGGQL